MGATFTFLDYVSADVDMLAAQERQCLSYRKALRAPPMPLYDQLRRHALAETVDVGCVRAHLIVREQGTLKVYD